MRGRTQLYTAIAAIAVGFASLAVGSSPPKKPASVTDIFSLAQLRAIARLSPLGDPPVDASNSVSENPAAARFGQRLFFESGLSFTGEISCATCHDPNNGFSDGREISIGEGLGERNAPTLWNVAYNRWQFWDGRADSLWAQALAPFETMAEMGSTRNRVVRAVANDPALNIPYTALFGALPEMNNLARFPIDASPVEMDDGGVAARGWERMSETDRDVVNAAFVNIGKAIAAYERLLVTKNSRFDVFVEGLRTGDAHKLNALSATEMRGLGLFVGDAGCVRCHSGPNFTDGSFHDNRVAPLGGGEPKDTGRFGGIEKLLASEFTRDSKHSDAPKPGPDHTRLVNGSHNWGAFKAPTLRNVELSAPYMHQGQFASLRDVLDHYNTLENATPLGHHSQEQILKPLGLDAADLDALEAFLRSLTDVSIDNALLKRP